MESFAFHDIIHIIRINLISTDIPQNCSKLFFFSLESFELHFELVLNGKSMNQKAKPHKRSKSNLVVGDQNGIRVLGMCRFVSEEFDNVIALYYGKIWW